MGRSGLSSGRIARSCAAPTLAAVSVLGIRWLSSTWTALLTGSGTTTSAENW
jgi:hypothetical protein